MIAPHLASAHLHVDLGALARNWRRLDDMTGASQTAAVLKANAYGTGVEHAAPALWQAGCRSFFVAHITEGLRLREVLAEAEIFVLNGLPPGAAGEFISARLIPVLNTLDQIADWRGAVRDMNTAAPCAIHIDTGMTRLGLMSADVAVLKSDPERLNGLNIRCWMTHPACADDADHDMNAQQLDLFRTLLTGLPEAPVSAANSAAICLGPDWHFDLCRPGVALYGSSPEPLQGGPMAEVVHLSARILQIHDIRRKRSVGYGATQTVAAGSRIATCGVGYADGYLRTLSNVGYGVLAGHRVPLVGRVSMDLITFDVSAVPEAEITPESQISLLGGGVDVDELAALGGTIAYELLTGLGTRYARSYATGGQT